MVDGEVWDDQGIPCYSDCCVSECCHLHSLYCSCERLGVHVHALSEKDVITILYASMCIDVTHNALILRGLASVDMLSVAISPRPAPVKAVTVKIYAVPNSSWPTVVKLVSRPVVFIVVMICGADAGL